jgi:hypothetical protein
MRGRCSSTADRRSRCNSTRVNRARNWPHVVVNRLTLPSLRKAAWNSSGSPSSEVTLPSIPYHHDSRRAARVTELQSFRWDGIGIAI